MAKATITGDTPFDGEYPLDMTQQFNGHEAHIMKELAGVRILEFREAVVAGDYDLLVALAIIALCRAGKVDRRAARQIADILLEAPGGAVTLDFREDTEAAEAKEDEDRPPESATASGEPSVAVENVETTESSPPTGQTGSNGGGLAELDLSRTGSLG